MSGAGRLGARGGSEDGGVKRSCFHLQAPTISAQVSDSYQANVIKSPLASSLARGPLEIVT